MSVLKAQGKNPLQVWSIKATKGDGYYELSLWEDYKFTCSCPQFRYKEASCRHIRENRLQLENLYGSIYNYCQMLKERKQ